MITFKDLFDLQSRYGVVRKGTNSDTVSYQDYLVRCRQRMMERTPREYYVWSRDKQMEYSDQLILQFVDKEEIEVDGYIDENGYLKKEQLIERLRGDIVDFGVLGRALADPSIQEIQVNDFKSIWVVRGGRTELYCDEGGNPQQFLSDDELHSTIDRMIYSDSGTVPRMTYANPILNGRTAQKGYRVAAVDSSAITRDMTVGFEFPVTNMTLRKYSNEMLGFEDFEKYGTLLPEMSEFLRYCGRADIKLICVGPTSSGKTTLLNAIVHEIPRDNRIILIQNPTEIMLYERSPETGANLRNVCHWEAQEVSVERAMDPTTPTMANLVAHTLRCTPDVVIPGELRTPEEFFQMSRVAKTGHRIMSTLHAENGKDAISRIATELGKAGGGDPRSNAQSMVDSLDIVVTQSKLRDGSRKVTLIEEYTGQLDEYGRAEVRVLFRYRFTGEEKIDENTGKRVLDGYFEQVDGISERLQEKFFKAGILKKDLMKYIEVPKRGGVE